MASLTRCWLTWHRGRVRASQTHVSPIGLLVGQRAFPSRVRGPLRKVSQAVGFRRLQHKVVSVGSVGKERGNCNSERGRLQGRLTIGTHAQLHGGRDEDVSRLKPMPWPMQVQ